MFRKHPFAWCFVLLLGAVGLVAPVSSISNGKDDVFAEIEQVERHHHNRERWFGVAAAPSGITNGGDSDVMAPYVPDAGNDAWGAWVLLLGTADTPSITGMTKVDPHQLFITTHLRWLVLYPRM